jgi:hydroxypyruvate reductase
VEPRLKRDSSPAERRGLLESAFRAAVAAADGGRAVLPHLPPLPAGGRLIVVGAGKAAVPMARAVDRHYRDAGHAPAGLVIAPDPAPEAVGNIRVLAASHPLPDERGVQATGMLLAEFADLRSEDLVICLLSGGGSALLTAPDGVSLSELAGLNSELLRSGADISEINTVRSHLCRVKGGGLAAAARPARLLALVISDVVGDDLSTVASGPTVPCSGSWADALAVLDRYGIDAPAARRVLEDGAAGLRPDKPGIASGVFERTETRLVASSQASLEAAAGLLESAGYRAHVLSDSVTGESRAAARFHAALTRQVLRRDQPFEAPCALVSGGETTVTLGAAGQHGSGGRNSDFALALALELWDDPRARLRVHALAADTDGIDGSAPVAGSFVTPALFAAASRQDAASAQASFDSHGFFAKCGLQLVTGPTGTNVNDLRIILIEEAA